MYLFSIYSKDDTKFECAINSRFGYVFHATSDRVGNVGLTEAKGLLIERA